MIYRLSENHERDRKSHLPTVYYAAVIFINKFIYEYERHEKADLLFLARVFNLPLQKIIFIQNHKGYAKQTWTDKD